MLEIGNIVRFYDNVGIVRKIFFDNTVLVQWLGRDFRNLKEINVEHLKKASEYDLFMYAKEIVLTTIKEIEKSTEDSNVIRFCGEAYEQINQIEYESKK